MGFNIKTEEFAVLDSLSLFGLLADRIVSVVQPIISIEKGNRV
jgi:hypothetical protein